MTFYYMYGRVLYTSGICLFARVVASPEFIVKFAAVVDEDVVIVVVGGGGGGV